jgi:hypothetical protein
MSTQITNVSVSPILKMSGDGLTVSIRWLRCTTSAALLPPSALPVFCGAFA